MKVFIKGISYYLPEKVITNEDLIKDFPEWNIDKISRKIGVKSRHISAQDETSGDMAEKAALKLFEEYNINPIDIDFILFCTQSPNYHLPSTACILQSHLGIPTNSGALDYDLGCSGCIYGMVLAKGLIISGIAKNVLLLTGETYNKYIHPKDKGNRSIFGDGAAACLISSNGFAEIGDFSLGTDGKGADNLIVRTGGARNIGRINDYNTDEDGHIKSSDYLYMNGSAIFNFTLKIVPHLLNDILAKNSMEKEKIDYYVFHQANKFMLNTLRKACVIPKDKFYINLENTGNTVSSTILIALKDCITNNIIKPRMNIMISGFGVGLSWGGTILKFI